MTNLLSPALSLAAAIAWGAADFSGGIATKRANVFRVVVIAHGTGLAFMLLLAFLAGESLPETRSAAWAVLAGLAGAVGLAAFYKSLAVGTMGVNAPLSAVITAIVPLVFSFTTQGLPRAMQLVGFVLALLSIWLIAAQHRSASRSDGLGLAIIAGCGFGGFLLFIKLAGSTTVFWPLAFARAASLLLMAAIAMLSRDETSASRSPLWIMMLAGLLDSGANALYVAATQHGRLDVAAVLSSMYPASTVLLARLVLKEDLSRLQMAGIGIALVAVGLISAK